jgi:zinc/manganese transport system permease protein
MDFILWLPALLAGMLVVLTHIPLGQTVLKKEVIFLDLAIAQAAALGVTIAHVLTIGSDTVWWHAIAALSAILMAGVFQYLEFKKYPYLEAWIGCSFVLTASVGLWLVSSSPHAAEHLKEILMGQILWVTPQNLWVTLAYYFLAAAVWGIWRNQFYLVFALCITASVQLVGVYLVFATLIMPALATAYLGLDRKKIRCFVGYALAILAYFVGIGLSQVGDWPASAMIILALAFVTLMTIILSRFKSLLGYI